MSKRSPLSIKLAQAIIKMIPNNNVLLSFATMYINKYHNFSNIDIYQNGEHRWLEQAIAQKKQPIIFDVGANLGKWTQGILSISPSAIIHAFEPTPSIFSELSKQPFPPNVHLNAIGLGNKQGEMAFYQYGAHTHNSLYQSHDETYQSVVTVQIDTISRYCTQHNISHIDYLKIDTEGNDYFVLQGAKTLLEQEAVDVIQFEYGSKYIDARVFLRDVFEFIKPFNYSIYRIMPKKLLHIPKYEHIHEKFVYANYTIIHHDMAKQLGLMSS